MVDLSAIEAYKSQLKATALTLKGGEFTRAEPVCLTQSVAVSS